MYKEMMERCGIQVTRGNSEFLLKLDLYNPVLNMERIQNCVKEVEKNVDELSKKVTEVLLSLGDCPEVKKNEDYSSCSV